MKSMSTGSHGQVRGLESTQRSPQFEGRFGRMFRTLRPARSRRLARDDERLAETRAGWHCVAFAI